VSDKKIKAILLGYSGHAYVVAEAAINSGIELLGYANGIELIQNPFHLNYMGDEREGYFPWNICTNYLLGVGSNEIRARIAGRVKANNGRCLLIIHPDSSLSETIEIGAGTFVARQVSVNPFVKIGENCILNTSCVIDHECIIGDNVHIAPGAVLAGNVQVGNGAFIGANSVVKEGIIIGENAVIGAGSVVLKNVLPDEIVVGNPAKPIKK
jgi:sugar O-acyltransferase (sialic acid O-acetyltransferase NeuD family)